jgi:hypothetical protein
MAKKSQRIKRRSRAEERAALDRVVALVRSESDRYLSPYEIGLWILYACDRSDAMMFAAGDAEGIHPGEDDDPRTLTMEEELAEKGDRWHDDADEVYDLIETQKMLGKRYDPGYRKPVLGQDDWLEKPDPESADVLRRVVDNAIDSSRRAARKR